MAKGNSEDRFGYPNKADDGLVSGFGFPRRQFGSKNGTENLLEFHLDTQELVGFDWKDVDPDSPLYKVFDLDGGKISETEKDFLDSVTIYLAKQQLPLGYKSVAELEKLLKKKFNL